MASGSTLEMRKSKGFDSESIPIPSPRNLSAVKMSSLEQSEEQKSRLDSHHNSDHPTSGALEGGEQNLTALSQEVDYLRQTNKKLQEALMSRERELDTLKLDAELLEQASQARIAERTAGSAAPPSAAVGRVPPDVSAPPSSTAGRRPPSSQHAAAAGEHRKCRSKTQALVEEVYCAQRERDEAVMARLRLANQERDEALIRVQQLQLFLRELEDINPEEGDLTLQELLGRLGEAEGGAAIQQNGELILERIRRSQERREQITAEEMGAVIRERDAARAQCKHLEKELHLLRESKQICTDIVTAQRTFHPASKHDEDKVIEDYKKLEEELQNLRIYYSLHQSLSQEANLKEQFSAAMALYDEALRNREELLRINQQQNQELGLQLHEAQSQNAEMQESLRRAAACQQEMEEKVHKLERLVDVLRKKVGVGNVRTVI